MQLKMLIPPRILNWILSGERTVAISTIFSILILSVFNLLVVNVVRFHELFRAGFCPLVIIKLSFPPFSILSGADFFLLDKIKVQTVFDDNLNEKIFPVLKENSYFLFKLL